MADSERISAFCVLSEIQFNHIHFFIQLASHRHAFPTHRHDSEDRIASRARTRSSSPLLHMSVPYVCAIFAALYAVIFIFINNHVPDPYMVRIIVHQHQSMTPPPHHNSTHVYLNTGRNLPHSSNATILQQPMVLMGS